MSGFKVIVSCSHCNEEMFAAELEPHLLSVISKQQAALDAVREFPCHHEAMNSCGYCHGESESVPCQWRSEFLKAIAKAEGGDV